MFFLVLIWIALAAFSPLNGFQASAAFALLVAFPLALALDTGAPMWLRRAIHSLAPWAAASLLAPHGWTALLLAVPWVGITLVHLAYGLVRFMNSGAYRTPAPWAEASAAAGPVVAAVALCWSRWDGSFAGFPDPLATLTVTHFHFTFGLLPTALAALSRGGRVQPLPVWGVVLAPPLIGLLFALRADRAVPGPAELVAIGGLTLAMAALPLFTQGWLARLGAALLAAGTALAAVFSLRLVQHEPTLSYAEMLRWHGIAQGVGATLLGLAAATSPIRGAAAPEPTPDLEAPTRDVAPERALFRDERDIDLGPDEGGRFEAMSEALIHYRFYPDHVMRKRTTFGDEGRPARPGDRIGMVLLVSLFPGLPPVALPATTEVTVAERGPDRAALAYVTTTRHYGKGAWSAAIRREGGRIVLHISSRMTPLHPFALLGLPIYRWSQKRAHRLGAENLAGIQR